MELSHELDARYLGVVAGLTPSCEWGRVPFNNKGCLIRESINMLSKKRDLEVPVVVGTGASAEWQARTSQRVP